jgi:hypothetical protein
MSPGVYGVGAGRTLERVLELRTIDGRPVADADLSIESWMPEAGQQADVQPVVSRGSRAGTCSVAGLTIDEPGWWNLRIGIDASMGADSLAFNLILP